MSMTAATRIYSIASHQHFVQALARELLNETRDDFTRLARMKILVPTRRAARALETSFQVMRSGAALLLPQILPLGDLGEDETAIIDPQAEPSLPPVIDPRQRLLEIAPLVQKWLMHLRGQPVQISDALATAQPLLALLDQFTYGQVTRGDLADLVTDDHAQHWQLVLQFLDIALMAWPQRLNELAMIDPALARDLRLRLLAQHWQNTLPTTCIIAAGSTGSVPAVADLLRVIARLPNGRVILPGVDTTLEDTEWAEIKPAHPQYALRQLLEHIGIARQEVMPWPGDEATATTRARVVHASTWPAAKTYDWQYLSIDQQAFTDVKFVVASTQEEEARVIALAMRRVLEQPKATAALVTSDRQLARRVRAHLRRFAIDVDDSAGEPLTRTSLFCFFALIADVIATQLAPIPLLALLKHPLCCGGMARVEWLDQVRRIDLQILRGPRPLPGIAGLRQASASQTLDRFIAALEKALAPLLAFADGTAKPLGNWIALHRAVAEQLASTECEAGSQRLWRGNIGDILQQQFSFYEKSELMITVDDYAATLERLLGPEVVRIQYGRHPRLAIWGPLEARLQHADLMILGSLNEGSWPQGPQIDPYLNDRMRAQLKLPTSEFRIGQAAHDFVQCLGAPRLLLTRAARINGIPATASRFWLRLAAVTGERFEADCELARIMTQIDVPDIVKPACLPAPKPCVSARPKQAHVTDIELWRRNPFAFYAKHILKLHPLDDIDAEPDASQKGIVLHKALEDFLRPPQRDKSLAALEHCGANAFASYIGHPLVKALWWPRFMLLATEFIAAQHARSDWQTIAVEARGQFLLPGTDFMVKGRADRIDWHAQHGLTIIDYKSSPPPSNKEVDSAYAVQLPLLGMIAAQGGFESVPMRPVADLLWWPLKTGADYKLKSLKGSAQTTDEAINKVVAILYGWIKSYESEEVPYKFNAGPDRGPNRDYDHLARRQEWEGRTS